MEDTYLVSEVLRTKSVVKASVLRWFLDIVGPNIISANLFETAQKRLSSTNRGNMHLIALPTVTCLFQWLPFEKILESLERQLVLYFKLQHVSGLVWCIRYGKCTFGATRQSWCISIRVDCPWPHPNTWHHFWPTSWCRKSNSPSLLDSPKWKMPPPSHRLPKSCFLARQKACISLESFVAPAAKLYQLLHFGI